MLIGLTGSYGAGKDEVARYLQTKGFIHYSLSDLIREELMKEKIEITRTNLIKKGNQLRKKFGSEVLALKVMERLRTRDNFVISSIRNTGEINVLKKRSDFILVYVDAPLEIRFKRTKLRNRENDPKTIEEFKQKEKIEQSEKKSNQQLHKCKKLAKTIITNDSSLNDLYHKVDCFLKDLLPKLVSPRPNWDEYFLKIAMLVSERSTCLRHHVGSIIVKNKRILTTGYNGAAAGIKDCIEKGCLRNERGIESGTRHEICRAIHSEQNAIIQAGIHGVNVEGGTIYCTHTPCILCAKMLVNAGIKRYVTYENYPDNDAFELFKEAGVKIVKLSKPEKEIKSMD